MLRFGFKFFTFSTSAPSDFNPIIFNDGLPVIFNDNMTVNYRN